MRGATGEGLRAAAAIVVLVTLAIVFAMPPEEVEPVATHEADDGPGSIRIFFTPVEAVQSGPEINAEQALVAAFGEAEQSIDVAAYNLDLTQLSLALAAAHARGVRVRMVIEADNRMRSEIQDLHLLGVPVRCDDRPLLMHHKFIVIDGRQVWTGSMNLTFNGVYRNNNNLLAIESRDLALDYGREFEEMFDEDRFGALSRPDTPFPFLTVGSAAIEVAFAPEDGVQARVLRSLDLAQERVDVLAFSLTADPIAEALVRAQARGVVVRVVIESDRFDRLGSDGPWLRSEGVQVRRDANPFTMHHKIILIDDRVVITGSYNFSQSAEEQNDENMLIITDRVLTGTFTREFERIYDASIP